MFQREQPTALLGAELRRIPLPRTWVNTLPVNAPNPTGWHHAHGVDPLEKGELARRRRRKLLCR